MQTLRIPAAGVELEGDLALAPGADGLVIFAHGSGSSRFSTRNRFVADVFERAGLATLLFDLLTAEEEAVDQRTAGLRFDIGLLGERLTATVDWLAQRPSTAELAFGLFGASTGAAAALIAAANRPDKIRAVVSRGGRPDLAGERLAEVRAPTLLIVGSLDEVVIDLNIQAAQQLRAPHQLSVIHGATHLFPEPGKLDEVAALSREWFLRYLTAT